MTLFLCNIQNNAGDVSQWSRACPVCMRSNMQFGGFQRPRRKILKGDRYVTVPVLTDTEWHI